MNMDIRIYEGEAEACLYPVPQRVVKRMDVSPCGAINPSNWLYLHRLYVPWRGRRLGTGRYLLIQAVKLAGQLNKGLVLRVCPFDAKGLTKRKLRKFYTEFGFKPVPRSGDLMWKPY